MIVALIVFFQIGLILWMLWRLDRSYKRKEPAYLGWLAFKDDPVPPKKNKRIVRA